MANIVTVGTGVIIISPTRELSMQTFGVLREVMQEHTQTYGLIMGGADRKSEAAKLAKGKIKQLLVWYISVHWEHLCL